MAADEVRHWVQWHRQYEDPGSRMSQRLVTVQGRIRSALTDAPPGPVRVVSLCAGDGRDLLGALADHPRRAEVTARLVELDPDLAGRAIQAAAAAGAAVDVVTGDAALTDHYGGSVPAELVLVCGVFGNISDADVAATIGALPEFTAPGGQVIWTRHRGEPDLVPAICEWFTDAGFDLVWRSPKLAGYGVGVHRLTGPARPLRTGRRLFTFSGRGTSGPAH